MKSRIQNTSRATLLRFAIYSGAAVAVTACLPPGQKTIVSPSQLNVVCDPFNNSGNATPGGPLNGLVASLSYLPNGYVGEYNGVMDFERKATPVSTPVYLSQLYVPTESFTQGFATGAGTYLSDNKGNKLTSFFALHIESTIQLQPTDEEGSYQFAIVSDDGSIMQVGNGSQWQTLINNDGNHMTEMGCAQQSVALTQSSALPIQIDYFQGPPTNIALVLLWRKVSAGSTWHSGNGGQCDKDNANPLNDPDCGLSGNDLYFDWENHVPSIPNSNWINLLARGWSVVPPKNFVLANGASNPCNTNNQCYTDTFNQPQQGGTNSVDFLLMSDVNSDYDRSGIASSLQNFANELPSGADFTVGVMAGYGSNGKAGTLMHAPSVNTVLSSKGLSMSVMENQLAQSISYLPSDRESDNGELGLYSLAEAMSPANVAAAQAAGFLRSNAALNVVFLSDQPDQCSVNPNAHPECASVNPAFDLAALQAVKGTQPISINAIVRSSNNCGENYGAGYTDLVNLLHHGLSTDMIFSSCGNDVTNFGQAMQAIGEQVATLLHNEPSAPLLNAFTLSHTGVNASTIAVSVNGSTASYTYNSSHDQVDVANAGTYGSTIQVNYCLAPSPSPSPSPSVTPSPSPSVKASPSPSPTVTVAPSPSPTVTVAPSPSPTVTVAPSPSPTVTVAPSPSPTVTVAPSPSPSVTIAPSPSPTVTVAPSPSPSVTVAPSPSPTVTASPSPAPSSTGLAPTPSPTVSTSPTASPSPSPSSTATDTPSPSPSPSASSCSGPFCGGGVLGN